MAAVTAATVVASDPVERDQSMRGVWRQKKKENQGKNAERKKPEGYLEGGDETMCRKARADKLKRSFEEKVLEPGSFLEGSTTLADGGMPAPVVRGSSALTTLSPTSVVFGRPAAGGAARDAAICNQPRARGRRSRVALVLACVGEAGQGRASHLDVSRPFSAFVLCDQSGGHESRSALADD
ncbi:hypothetical protein MRX96_030759 [Rhipicephalus microplus]